jgi:DNA-binding transcriptional LysR family regulator
LKIHSVSNDGFPQGESSGRLRARRLVDVGDAQHINSRTGFRLAEERRSMRTAALDGVGIAVLPIWAVAEQLRAGALRRVLEAWEPPSSTIYAVSPGTRLISMKVRAFVDHLARCFGRTPYWEDGL